MSCKICFGMYINRGSLFLCKQVGEQYRSNDDGEPSGTAGKPIHSAIVSSGLDRVMVVVIRYMRSQVNG